MIRIQNTYAKLDTPHTTLLLQLKDLPEIIYYGERLRDAEDYSYFGSGTDGVPLSSADDVCSNACVLSSSGDGSNRETMLHIVASDGSGTLRPVLFDAKVQKGKPLFQSSLPSSYGESESLILWYKDSIGLEILQYFTVFKDSDVIATSVRLRNTGEKSVHIRRCMSLQLDLGKGDWEAVTLDGASQRERCPHRTLLRGGSLSAASFAGLSSNAHNPYVIARNRNNRGGCIACNLVWSGNHRQIFDLSPLSGLRLLSGISDYLFNYKLDPGKTFEAPEAVFMRGEEETEVCEQMRAFAAEHIVRGEWKKKARPILINSWEGFLFSFDQKKLMEFCRRAAQVGIELFVLDDGWFGKRDDDTCSLGDWKVNRQKIGGTLREFADKVRKSGLMFGIWMEPEMISKDSDLFRAHPEYVLSVPQKETMEIRHQRVLDLTNPKVRQYMVEAISSVVEESGASYLKWDCNRGIFDLPGAEELFYRYTLGLYEVLDTITKKYPKLLIESCASGGNRYDLGMLCFTPQIWASDNTDARSRLAIQEGALYGYPQSSMGAHVGASPNPHTFNSSSPDTRFSVASAGAFGYECDITALSEEMLETVRSQVVFYKQWREVMQFGRYYRTDSVFDGEASGWIFVSEDSSRAVAVVALLEKGCSAIPFRARFQGLDPNALYQVSSRPQKGAVPIFFKAYGDALCHGNIRLGNLFTESEMHEYSNQVVTRMFTFTRIG